MHDQSHPRRSELIAGYPICTGVDLHHAENMRIIELERGVNKPQRERWRCPICRSEYRCEIQFGRDIPEALRP